MEEKKHAASAATGPMSAKPGPHDSEDSFLKEAGTATNIIDNTRKTVYNPEHHSLGFAATLKEKNIPIEFVYILSACIMCLIIFLFCIYRATRKARGQKTRRTNMGKGSA